MSVADSIETSAAQPPAYEDVVRAFQAVGEALVGDVERDPLLRVVLHKVCGLMGVRRGSLYLLDEESGLFHGQVGVSGETSIDADIKQYRAGVPADRFTNEILETRAPVLVADAQHDPRPMRSVIRRWNIRSLLGVPMIVGEEVRGLMFLDDIDRLHEFTPAQQALASAFADMAAVAITTAQRADALTQSMRTVARQNNLLRKAVAMEERLTTLALRGGTIADVTTSLAELINEPCAVHDVRFRRLAAAVPSGETSPPQLLDEEIRNTPEVRAALDGLPEGEPQLLGPFPRAGLHRRCLVVPIRAREETWGYLLVSESKSALRTMETLVSSRAAAIIALSVTFQRSAAETEMYAREALVRRLIDAGAPSPGMAAQAEFHGLRAGRPYVAAVLANRGAGGRTDGMAVEDAAAGAGLASVWLAGTTDGALSVVAELSAHTDDVKERFDSLVTHLSGAGTMFAAVSDVCHSVDDLAAAHRDAKQVLRILQTFAVCADSPNVLTARELGAGCMLLAAADSRDADRVVARALGPLADADNPKALEVLQTLHAFVACSWGIRRTATQLQVHENTVRYRLGRLAEETGRDVLTDPRAQLDAQIALVILRLQGRLGSLD